MPNSLFAPYQELAQQAWLHYTETVQQHDPALTPMLRHHFAISGKLLRPALTIAFYDQLQGSTLPIERIERPSSVLDTAVAIELLHNGTLIHDDLQDGDDTRRGHPTVWKKFCAYQAINAGSALYFHAQHCLLQMDASPEQTHRLMRLLSEQALDIVAGQAAEKELWNEMDPTDFAQAKALYFNVVEKKTSALFALPLVSAAILANEPQKVTEGLLRIAKPLGALFQIQDDLLDLYGNKGRETPGNDIAEGKPSLIALHYLHHAPKASSHRLLRTLQTPREDTSLGEIHWAIEQFQSQGSLQACLDQIAQLQLQAFQQLAQLPFQGKREKLEQFLNATIQKLLQPIAHLTSEQAA